MTRTLESQRAMNSEQLAQRVKMGDHLELVREVEHFALFTGRKQADAARAELAAAGFNSDTVRKGWSKFELRARQQTSIRAAEVDHAVCAVFAIVTAHHGDYDGWTGPLAAPAPERPTGRIESP
jgi:hypothetical protein